MKEWESYPTDGLSTSFTLQYLTAITGEKYVGTHDMDQETEGLEMDM